MIWGYLFLWKPPYYMIKSGDIIIAGMEESEIWGYNERNNRQFDVWVCLKKMLFVYKTPVLSLSKNREKYPMTDPCQW